MERREIPRAWIAVALFAASLAVYLYNYRYRFWAAGGDTAPAELLPLALARNHALYFDGFTNFGSPGSWSYRIKGHDVSAYPIIPGLFNIPTYAIAYWRGVPLDPEHRSMLSMITASVLVALSVAFFFLAISRIVTRRSTAVVASLLYAFATTAGSVAARGIWQHGPSLLFLTIALWLLARSDPRSVALSGLPLGFAVFNRPVNLLIVAPLAVFVLWEHRRAFLPFCAAAAVPAGLLTWYSVHYWGSVTAMGQYPAGKWFIGHMPEGLAGLLVSPSRGLLVFTPLFLFSFVFMFIVLRHPTRDPLLTALSIGPLLTLIVYSKWWSWWGGTSFGYRLLTECVPALMILLAVGWERLFARSAALRVVLASFAAWSIAIHLLGAFYYPCGGPDVNAHPEHLWDVRGGEIDLCACKMRDRVARHLR